MGNVFSGATEDLLLYFVCPGIALVTLLTLARALTLLAARLRENTHWERRGADVNEASLRYRTAAAQTEMGAPPAIRHLALGLVLWAFGNAALWVLVFAVAAIVERYWACLTAPLCLVACYQVTECAFALADRQSAEVHKHLRRARRWVALHHGLWFLVGTTLFVLLMLSTAYFWNSSDDHVRRQGQYLGAYLFFVVVPTGGAFLLHRALKRIASHYPHAKESGERAT